MILEGLVTTAAADGRPHVAAMGPGVDDDERAAGRIGTLLLRPFPTSQTATNLLRSRAGVFHLCDDVLLLARVVAGEAGEPAVRPATVVPGGFVLTHDRLDDCKMRMTEQPRHHSETDRRCHSGESPPALAGKHSDQQHR